MAPEKTRKQLREEAAAKKDSQHVDGKKLRARFDDLIHDIDEVLRTNE